MPTSLHRITSRALPRVQSHDKEEWTSEGQNKLNSMVPVEVQIHDQEKMSESYFGEASPGFDSASMKKLVKLDLRLILILAIIYVVCILDRTNVGNAQLDGLEKDLHMAGLDYNIALSVFFPFQNSVGVPSNIIIQKLRPHVWLTAIVLAWSVVMVCMGLIHKFAGFLITRFFLCISKGGLYPGVVYYVTMWFARGISDMSVVAGGNGWSWIFIIEGLLIFCVEFIWRLSY